MVRNRILLMIGLLAGSFSPLVHADNFIQEVAAVIHTTHIDHPPKEKILKLTINQINGFLKTLDPYSAYLNAESFTRVRGQEREGYARLGIEVTRDTRGVVIVPFLGGPAYRAGIKQRGFLWEIDGQSIKGIDLSEIGKRLHGLTGSHVIISVSHTYDGRREKFRLVREDFLPSSIEEMTVSGYSVIRIRKFKAHHSTVALKNALKRAKGNTQPVIIDLREASGGDLFEALDSVSYFLSGGKLVAKTDNGKGKVQRYYSLPGQQLIRKRILALIGPATASAAEVFLAALKKHDRVFSVGQETFGKCTSQTYVELSNGSALKLTNLKIIYPSEIYCNGEGIRPDLVITDGELYQTKTLIQRGIERMN